MKRMGFERPTDYYDERLYTIDEKICALLKERKNFQMVTQVFLMMKRFINGQSNTNFIQTI